MKAWNSTFKPSAKPMRRGEWKKRAPKKRAGHSRTMLLACRGQRCYLCVPFVCLGAAGAETVVPCHSNQQIHGKGMGIKADDKFTVPGCAACHAWLDQGASPKEIKSAVWNLAYERWAAYRDREVA